ncbi:MAG: hypothetical protein RL763_1273 [Pseudomonadota bacterium]|jgi:hypothetical protein
MDESRLADGKTPALTQRPRRKKQFTRQALFFYVLVTNELSNLARVGQAATACGWPSKATVSQP